MTQKQIIKWNKMLQALREIANGYQTPDELRKNASKLGLSFEEAIEMAYENIQETAKEGYKGASVIN